MTLLADSGGGSNCSSPFSNGSVEWTIVFARFSAGSPGWAVSRAVGDLSKFWVTPRCSPLVTLLADSGASSTSLSTGAPPASGVVASAETPLPAVLPAVVSTVSWGRVSTCPDSTVEVVGFDWAPPASSVGVVSEGDSECSSSFFSLNNPAVSAMELYMQTSGVVSSHVQSVACLHVRVRSVLEPSSFNLLASSFESFSMASVRWMRFRPNEFLSMKLSFCAKHFSSTILSEISSSLTG